MFDTLHTLSKKEYIEKLLFTLNSHKQSLLSQGKCRFLPGFLGPENEHRPPGVNASECVRGIYTSKVSGVGAKQQY